MSFILLFKMWGGWVIYWSKQFNTTSVLLVWYLEVSRCGWVAECPVDNLLTWLSGRADSHSLDNIISWCDCFLCQWHTFWSAGFETFLVAFSFIKPYWLLCFHVEWSNQKEISHCMYEVLRSDVIKKQCHILSYHRYFLFVCLFFVFLPMIKSIFWVSSVIFKTLHKQKWLSGCIPH